jgi:hypothetical protein
MAIQPTPGGAGPAGPIPNFHKEEKHKVGEEFVIKEKYVPTAGYEIEAKYPKDRFELISETTVKPEQGMEGGSTTQVYKFKGKTPCLDTIVIIKKRPWEDPEKAIKEVYTEKIEA